MSFSNIKKTIENCNKLDCGQQNNHRLRVFNKSSNGVSGSLWIEISDSSYQVYTTGKITQLLYGYIEENLGPYQTIIRDIDAWNNISILQISKIIKKFNELDFRDSFSKKTRTTLAERAGFICSNPECNKLTVGPCFSNAEKSINVGVAAHIHAASSLGPRYKKTQTPDERKHIDNAIWMCGSCSYLIDKNNGNDYTHIWLKDWKSRHELLVKELLESGYNLLASKRGNLQKNKSLDNLIINLENKMVLYTPFEYEHIKPVTQSLLELRKELTSFRKEMTKGGEIDKLIQNMLMICRKCLNEISGDITPVDLHSSIGVLRKAFGLTLYDLSNKYKVKIEGELISILPKITDY